MMRQLAASAVSRALIGVLRLLTGVQTHWVSTKPSSETTVYFANHGSHGDFVLVWVALPADLRRATRPVAAHDYWGTSPVRRFLGVDVFKALLIRRTPAAEGSAAATSEPTPVDQMADVLRGGQSLILFPEGTRNTNEDVVLLPFKSGLFHLTRTVPSARLVPVWIEGLRRVLPKGVAVPIPLACTVHFGPPISLGKGEDKAAFLDRARTVMLALRPEHAREEH